MQVTVKLFALASQLAGSPQVELELSEKPTVGELRSALKENFSELAPICDSLLFAIDTEYAQDTSTLPENSDIACFPPVSGG